MSIEELDTLLKEATEAFRSAMDLRGRGRKSEARFPLLETASKLYEAAALTSDPQLRESRKRLARSVMEEAADLPRLAAPAAVPAVAAGKLPADQASLPKEDKRNAAPGGDDAQAETWLVHEKPAIRFDDIAGLEEVKEQIRLKLLYPFQHAEVAAQYGIRGGGGILLYGPPGTGKTMIARAIAGEIDAAYFSIKPSEVMNQWVGLSEQNLARLFGEADSYPLSIIFIDEIESLAPKRRGQGSTIMQRVVPQILAELDGFEKRKNTLLFIGATNEPWALDPALLRPGRLDRLVYVSPPDPPARRKILELNLKSVPLAEDVDLDAIAARSESFSGADMAALAQRVREKVFTEAVRDGTTRPLAMADFESVLAGMRPSVRPEELRLYEEYAQKQGGK